MKARHDDYLGRFREVISDPLNILIKRDPLSGMVDKEGYVCLHNGNKVPISGENSYYGNFSQILVMNRGVHEPLEEFCFQDFIAFCCTILYDSSLVKPTEVNSSKILC